MIHRSISSAIAVTAVALFTTAIAAQSQNPSQPQSQTPSQPQSQTPSQPRAPQSAQPATPSTTITGCLYDEDAVPGRTPNIAERAGVLEDYILVADAGANQPGRAVGTSGSTASMFKVERISDDKLKPLVGKKVEVTGRVDQDDARTGTRTAKPDQLPGGDKVDIPEFEATAIREVSGTCPSAPAAPAAASPTRNQ